MKTIKTKQAPQAIGPYSQAKIVNGFIDYFWSDSTGS